MLIKSKDFIQIFVIYPAVTARSPVFGLEEQICGNKAFESKFRRQCLLKKQEHRFIIQLLGFSRLICEQYDI